MHILRDGMTCIPQEAWLDPELRHHLPHLRRIAARMEASGREVPGLENLSQKQARDWLYSYINHAPSYCLPFLSAEYCDKLVVEADLMAQAVGYTPNEEEEEDYQIPELVLREVCPQLHTGLAVFKQQVIDTYSMLLMGVRADYIASIQFARYEPRGVAHGNWHVDANSDVTAVVSLQPELFTGGGTDLRLNAWDSHHVPKLPKGHMLLFNGKGTLHRGCAVTEGRRDLLVFWNEYEERE